MDARTSEKETGADDASASPEDFKIRRRFSLSPINRRRWMNFKSNRRGFYSFWIFLILFFVSLFAEFIANDKPFFDKAKTVQRRLFRSVERNRSSRSDDEK